MRRKVWAATVVALLAVACDSDSPTYPTDYGDDGFSSASAIGVFRRIGGQNGGLVGHRQTHSVRVCSPPSRRVAPLRPRSAGLTAWTPAPRTPVLALV